MKIKCEICHNKFRRTHNRQKLCKNCREEIIKKIVNLYGKNYSIRRIACEIRVYSISSVQIFLKHHMPNYRHLKKFKKHKKIESPEERQERIKTFNRTMKEKRWLPIKGLTYNNPYTSDEFEYIMNIGSVDKIKTKTI